LPLKPRQRNVDETTMLVVSQPELRRRSEPIELDLNQSRRTEDIDEEVGKKYFKELVKLGMGIGSVLLVLVAITIVLSIFYRPFYVTQIEAEAAAQLAERRNTPNPLSSNSILPETLGSIKFLYHQSENLWSHKSPEESKQPSLPRSNSAREIPNEVFVRLPEIDNNPVFDYSTPIVTPFVRRRTGALRTDKMGGTKYTFIGTGEKKELKVPNDGNLVPRTNGTLSPQREHISSSCEFSEDEKLTEVPACEFSEDEKLTEVPEEELKSAPAQPRKHGRTLL